MTPAETLKTLVKELHDEQYNTKCRAGSHVDMVFADGEHCSTKGGELFGMRTLHCFASAVCPDQRFAECFPMTYNGFRFAFVKDENSVGRIREAIKAAMAE